MITELGIYFVFQTTDYLVIGVRIRVKAKTSKADFQDKQAFST